MTDQLKPCAYCGSKAEYSDNKSENYGFDCPGVECTSCFVRNFKETKDQAIAAWNTRHIPEGYKLVPIKPTYDMQEAGVSQYNDEVCGVTDIYKAMLKA